MGTRRQDWRSRPRKPDTTIGEVVRRAREARNLTQHQLAVAIGTQSPYISKIEQGKIKMPAMHYIVPLAEALSVSQEDLYRAMGVEMQTERALPEDVSVFAGWLSELDPGQREQVYRVAQAQFANGHGADGGGRQ